MAHVSDLGRLTHMVAEALQLADHLGLREVGISLDRALTQLDGSNPVLRDSAERIWKLPD